MAKKKVNVRFDYSYEAKMSLPKYDTTVIRRKSHFLILRGPGFDPRTIAEENIPLKKLAVQKQAKLKFIQANTEEAIIKALKDATPWATGAIYHAYEMTDLEDSIKKVIKKLLYPIVILKGDESFEDALEKLKPKKSK